MWKKEKIKENKRILTKVEQQRKEQFEKIKMELEASGYSSYNLTVGIVFANVMSFVLGLPIIILLGIWFSLKNPIFNLTLNMVNFLLFYLLFILLVILHEFIHGFFWAIFARKHWQSISFGFIAKYLTPYCSCKEALQGKEYIIGGIMPTLLLGILPALIAIFINSSGLFLLGCVMIICGGGDLTIILKLLKFHKKNRRNKDVFYIDHPYQGGLVAFVR